MMPHRELIGQNGFVKWLHTYWSKISWAHKTIEIFQILIHFQGILMHAVYFSFFKGSEDDYGNSAKSGPRPTTEVCLICKSSCSDVLIWVAPFFCLRHWSCLTFQRTNLAKSVTGHTMNSVTLWRKSPEYNNVWAALSHSKTLEKIENPIKFE